MPCYRTGSAEGDASLDASEARSDVTKLTRLLCNACELLEDNEIPIRGSLREWWLNHLRIDNARAARVAAEMKRAKLRSVALAKLTPEERAALGG